MEEAEKVKEAVEEGARNEEGARKTEREIARRRRRIRELNPEVIELPENIGPRLLGKNPLIGYRRMKAGKEPLRYKLEPLVEVPPLPELLRRIGRNTKTIASQIRAWTSQVIKIKRVE